MIDCKYCGRHIPYDANVCPYCARSLKEHKDNNDTDARPADAEPARQYVESQAQGQRKSNGWLYAIIVILVLMLLCVVGYVMLHGIGQVAGDDAANQDTTLVQPAPDNDVVPADADKNAPAKAKPARKEIVVNGEGVRMRFAPSLKAGFLKTKAGGTLSVNKGTRLPCVGEEGDWYKVVYQGKQYYMSKQFCVPAQ